MVADETGRKLLDVGCGDGGFLEFARERGFEVFGLDLDERAVEYARTVRGLKNVRAGIWQDTERTQGWRDFDFVTMFDVLEHLASPVTTLASVSRLLKSGGTLCITVPRLDRFPRIFDAGADFPPHHFTMWTSRALTVALTGAGFERIQVIEKPLLLEDLIAHVRWRLRRAARDLRAGKRPTVTACPAGSLPTRHRRPRDMAKEAMYKSLGVANWFLRTLRLGRGHTLLALARKG